MTSIEADEALLAHVIGLGENDYADSAYHHASGNLNVRLVADAARRRGLTVHSYGPSYYGVSGTDLSAQFMWSGADTSSFAWHVTQSKNLTRRLLAASGVVVPRGKSFSRAVSAEAYFSSLGVPAVVKPSRGSQGRGVAVNVRSIEHFRTAWNEAKRGSDLVLVEEQLAGTTVRVITVGKRAVAAYVRRPMVLVGDGERSLAQLAAMESDRRRTNPRLKRFPVTRGVLEAAGLNPDATPRPGVCVPVASFGNVNAGGFIVAVLDHLHGDVLRAAERAAGCIPGLPVAGVDVVVSGLSLATERPRVAVIEIDANPFIADAAFPSFGRPVAVAEAIMDFLSLRGPERPESAWDEPGFRSREYAEHGSRRAFSRSGKLQIELVKQAAYRRNLTVETFSRYTYAISDGARTVHFRETMPEFTRAIARRATSDKGWTKALLNESSLNTPKGRVFGEEQREEAWQYLQALAVPAVVKPLFGSGGVGITTNVVTREDFDSAFDTAQATGFGQFVVEEFIGGNDYRLLMVGQSLVAASRRIPAYVVGDGIHTVGELIERKNHDRLANPHNGGKPLRITEAVTRNFAALGYGSESIPRAGERIQLHSVANIGAGGEGQDVTDQIHEGFLAIALAVRKAVFTPYHLGIDVLAEDISRGPDTQRWAVVEVNANPDPGLHHFPSEGTPRDAAGALVESLFPQAGVAASSELRLRLWGKVQGVGYRRWVRRQARLRGAECVATNRPDGALDLRFTGTRSALQDLVSACRDGPRRARVSALERVSVAADGLVGTTSVRESASTVVSATGLRPRTADEEGAQPYETSEAGSGPAVEGERSPIAPLTSSRDANIFLSAAQRLGLQTEVFIRRPACCAVRSGERELWLRDQALGVNSTVARAFSHDKHLTNRVLRDHGLPVPEWASFKTTDLERIIDYALERRPVVIKPRTGSFNRGVCIDPRDEGAIRHAVQDATRLKSRYVQVEAKVHGWDYRILFFYDEIIGVVKWIPPTVYGDGEATLRALLERSNRWRKAYGFPQIHVEESALMRAGIGLDEVPAAGRQVVLGTQTAYRAGGEPVRIPLSDIHPDNVQMFTRAWQAVHLKMGGIDFISPDIGESYRDNGAAINEINAHPNIFEHCLADQREDLSEAEAILNRYFRLQDIRPA